MNQGDVRVFYVIAMKAFWPGNVHNHAVTATFTL